MANSISQLPHWQGEVSEPLRDHAVHNTFDDAFAIRNDGWVLVDAKTGEPSRTTNWYDEFSGYVSEAPEGAWLLDLSEDLPQRINLVTKHPEKAAELRGLLSAIRENGRSVSR